jgi:hypothetical protein
LNEGFVYSKYSPGQFFKPHKDGLFINDNEDHSIFSVVLYLNQGSSFKGGNLNFINKDNEKKEKNEVVSTYTPEKGSAIIFNSDALHEGEELVSGYKYILRTFVMFKCVKKFETDQEYKNDPNWQKILKLYDSFNYLSVNGDTTEFTRAYLEAQSRQLSRNGTIHSPSGHFPPEIYRLIFNYLTPFYIIKAMSISRSWYRECRDNETWKIIYRRKFSPPNNKNNIKKKNGEVKIKLEKGMSKFDWFNNYKMKSLAEKIKMSVLVMGDHATIQRGINIII